MILAYSNMNRKYIINNLEKIKTFYDKKILSEESLETLLNSDRNELFENIRDAALNGDQKRLNELFVYTPNPQTPRTRPKKAPTEKIVFIRSLLEFYREVVSRE